MQLAQSGHERIAFFRGPEITSSSFRDRWWGYHAAMTELGLEPIEMICGEASIVSAEQTMADWLDIHKQPSFTAIIGCNDQVAIGAMHALQHHGLRVPTDVAIIGLMILMWRIGETNAYNAPC
jgi:LacI family transcriptional regulator/LacI family purine nucleotide synthesis repressor